MQQVKFTYQCKGKAPERKQNASSQGHTPYKNIADGQNSQANGTILFWKQTKIKVYEGQCTKLSDEAEGSSGGMSGLPAPVQQTCCADRPQTTTRALVRLRSEFRNYFDYEAQWSAMLGG